MSASSPADGHTPFARLEALLDRALELPGPARIAHIEDCCDDAQLRAEAIALLRAMEDSEGFMETAPEPDIHAGRDIGPWRLQRRLGRGGMGEVWLGQRSDGRFEQQVAVKLLHRQDGDVARFVHEQRLLARLEHPGIARLIDAGSLTDGQPYMVMEYVDGVPLQRYCDEHAPTFDARIGLFLQVCDAVAFAHRHLVVHRDLKPDNILVRADGRVALIDFGIAQRLDDEHAEGSHGRALHLTPRYAAPEQFSGGVQTTLTDVHALGVLLHELLTGHSPWDDLDSAAPLAMLQRARSSAPPAPSSVAGSTIPARRLRGDLDAIVGKALQVEPEARYASVEALAEDLRRHCAHAPVRARGNRPGYRIARLLRRHWLAVGTALFVFTGMAVALAAISIARRDALRERDTAQVEASRSKAVRDYLAHMFRDASQHAKAQAPLTAKQVLERAAARVEAGFAGAPAENAEVLKALGELHFYIGDYAAAEPLLRRWLASEAAIDDATAAADVRFTLAEIVHRMGRRDEAKELLADAQATWARNPEQHVDVQLTSRALQARLQREEGDVDGALATLEAALPQRLARSGREHFETAVLYTNLGAAYGQAGRLDEGIAASDEAMALWRALGLDSGNDALNTLNNLAAMQFRRNDLAAAERTFAQALAVRRATLGPSAATAALIGNYARVLQRLGRHGDALEYAGEAEAMAALHAGAPSPLAQAARVTHAELLLALDRTDEARAVLASFAQHDPASLPASLRLRASVATAECRQRDGKAAAARASLDEAASLLDSAGTEGESLRPRIESLRALLAR